MTTPSHVLVARWHNHLNPDIKKTPWSTEEDDNLRQAHEELGNKWAEIAKRLPGRLVYLGNHLDCMTPLPYSTNALIAHFSHPRTLTSLRSRTDNAIKNRWNSTMRRREGKRSSPADASQPITAAFHPPVPHSSPAKLAQDDLQAASVMATFRQVSQRVGLQGFAQASLLCNGACSLVMII